MKTRKEQIIEILKSYHFWFWLVFIGVTLFVWFYGEYLLNQDDFIKSLEAGQTFFLWVLFAALWFFAFAMRILSE